MNVDISKLEESIEKIVTRPDRENFIYGMLDLYGFPRATVTLLKRDPSRLSKKDNEVILRNKLVFHILGENEDEHLVIDGLLHDKAIATHKPRFIIVTDFNVLLAIDTSTKETLDIPFTKLPKHYTFFLPWTGREKYRGENESPADIKAAVKMASLYDQLIAENPSYVKNHAHELNLFLTRLLFCFFAEDSGIFPANLFSSSIISHTSDDGSDFKRHLEELFNVLNIEDTKRSGTPEHLKPFPYVNGGLYQETILLPEFSRKSRALVVETSRLNWSEINPDIFGSMIQAVTHAGMREDLGMHYTSVSNILNVINPLFLESLRDELDKAGENVKRLEELRNRITKIRVFDPACGSGNFLIISFKKLCEIEIEIIDRIQATGVSTMPLSGISLNNFYGIEIDDFAHEIARLSLWLAQHQMNLQFKDVFGFSKPALPLKEAGRIVCGNATRLDWNEVCSPVGTNDEEHEIYIVGNPPYEGSRKQKESQKKDLEDLFKNDYKSLDYISAWFYKGARYISGHPKMGLAFVSTNSITQGEQVSLLWPRVFENDVIIHFAHRSFKWRNLAKYNAGVVCVIIGMTSSPKEHKYIYTEDEQVLKVENINPYLTEGDIVYIHRKATPISNFPTLTYGNMPNDGGRLIFSEQEVRDLLRTHPEAEKFIKRYMGGDDFLNGRIRYCLVIPDAQIAVANGIPEIKKRLEDVSKIRNESSEKSTREKAKFPNRFYFWVHQDTTSIIVPRTTSERRDYIPMGFLDGKTIISDSAQVIYNPPIFIFGVLTSRMHMVWVRAVGGKLKTDIRYSSTICYNTFPFPAITDAQKLQIEEHVGNILDEREKYPEKTLANLYDPELMPLGLRQAHGFLDEVIDQVYQKKPFRSDEERLACLFKLYEGMLTKAKK
jgi:hypothetical protein